MCLRDWRLLAQPFHFLCNVYSCKVHVIDSRRTRVAAFIGRQKERARRHAADTYGRQGQNRVYSSIGEQYNDKNGHINEN